MPVPLHGAFSGNKDDEVREVANAARASGLKQFFFFRRWMFVSLGRIQKNWRAIAATAAQRAFCHPDRSRARPRPDRWIHEFHLRGERLEQIK